MIPLVTFHCLLPVLRVAIEKRSKCCSLLRLSAMDNFRRKPSIVDEIRKQRILHVNDRKTLDYAVKILNRFARDLMKFYNNY